MRLSNMRLSVTILSIFVLFAGLAVVTSPGAAAPPPPAGPMRPQYVTAGCFTGFKANPATYPASAQNVKYQCFATASCPPLFTALSPSKSPSYTEFEYACKRDGSVLPAGTSTCSAGFAPSAPTYGAGEKLVYYCDTKPVSCPANFNVLDNGVDAGVIASSPPKFFYACIASGGSG